MTFFIQSKMISLYHTLSFLHDMTFRNTAPIFSEVLWGEGASAEAVTDAFDAEAMLAAGTWDFPVPECLRMKGRGEDMLTRDGWFGAMGFGSNGVSAAVSSSPSDLMRNKKALNAQKNWAALKIIT
jgi:hypothetical protein